MRLSYLGFALAVLCLSAQPAVAVPLWQNLEAGMSPADVRNAYPQAIKPDALSTVESGATCRLVIPTVIEGSATFGVCFYFLGEDLVQVTLSAIAPTRTAFENALKMLRGRHGRELLSGRDTCQEGKVTGCSANWLDSVGNNVNLTFLQVPQFLPVLNISYQSQTALTDYQAEQNLERGFNGALRGCEEWLLNPTSWASGLDPFIKGVGLGDQMGRVERVEEVNLPPEQFRKGMHFFRINSTPMSGYVLVLSDELPMCHITGGGGRDLQPSVRSVLSSPEFQRRWQQSKTDSNKDMATTVFRNMREPALSIAISRAAEPGQRMDRVQVLATATYDVGR
jgi:hypothetical protein